MIADRYTAEETIRLYSHVRRNQDGETKESRGREVRSAGYKHGAGTIQAAAGGVPEGGPIYIMGCPPGVGHVFNV